MDFKMWILLIWSWLAVSTTVYLIGKQYKHKSRRIYFLESLWNFLGCVFYEPVSKLDFWTPARYLYASWIAAAFVVTTVFSGNLKSSLTLSLTNKIETLQDILDRPEIRPIVAKGRRIELGFKKSTEGSTDREMWKQIERMNGSISFPYPDEVMKEVSEGVSVIIGFEDQLITSVNSYCSKHDHHSLYFHISQAGFGNAMSIVYFKSNGYVFEQLNRGLRRLFQSGLSDHYLKSRLYSSKSCFVQLGDSEVNPISMEGIVCTFHILLIGLLISCLVFLLECAFKFITRTNRTGSADCVQWKRDFVSMQLSKATGKLIISTLGLRSFEK